MTSNYTDISLDLETLGTKTGSAIAQIGVCLFNAGDPEIAYSARNFFVDPQSCLDIGMTVSWATIKWWLQQSEGARAAMVRDEMQTLPIADALSDFRNYVTAQTAEKDVRVWGNGATFDVVLLEDAMFRCNQFPPWHYRGVRDLRTLAALAPDAVKPAPLTEHVAMDDAVSQALWIQNLIAAVLK